MMRQTTQGSGDMLCRKLTFKYRNRFNEAISNAAAIEEKRKADSLKRKNARKAEEAKKRSAKVKTRPGLASAKRAVREPSFDGVFVPDGGRFTYAYARGAEVRANAYDFDRDIYRRCRPEVAREENTDVRETVKITKKSKTKAKKSISTAILEFGARRREETSAPDEKRIKTAPISKAFIAGVVLCTILLIVVLNTYSSFSQISSEVNDLKTTEAQLEVERDRLKGRLEIRDDIRVIENTAVNEIGMVQSDYVEKRYVSIAGGERIEVISNDSEDSGDASFFSTIFSVMGGQFERILDYID